MEFFPAHSQPDTVAVMRVAELTPLAPLADAVAAHGCQMVLYDPFEFDWRPESERRFLEEACQVKCRGLVAFCTPRQPRNDAALKAMAAAGVRVVHVEYYGESEPAEEHVLCDYRGAGCLAATKLLDAGAEHLYFVGFKGDGPFAGLLERGFADALSARRQRYVREKRFVDFHDLEQQTGAVVKAMEHDLAAGRPIGIFLRNPCFWQKWQLRPAVCEAQAAGRLMLVAATNDLRHVQAGHVDLLAFDLNNAYRRALEVLLAHGPGPVRERLPAVHMNRGSCRRLSAADT